MSTNLPDTPVQDSAFIESWKKVAPNIDPPKTPSAFMKPRPPTPSTIPSKITVNFVLPYASELTSKEVCFLPFIFLCRVLPLFFVCINPHGFSLDLEIIAFDLSNLFIIFYLGFSFIELKFVSVVVSLGVYLIGFFFLIMRSISDI